MGLQGARGSQAVHAVGTGAVRDVRVITRRQDVLFWFSVDSSVPGVLARPAPPAWLAGAGRPAAVAMKQEAVQTATQEPGSLDAKAAAWRAAAGFKAEQAGADEQQAKRRRQV